MPPLDSKNLQSNYDGMSHYSAQTSQSFKNQQNAAGKRKQSGTPQSIQMKQQLQKRIIEDAEGEVDQSRQYE